MFFFKKLPVEIRAMIYLDALELQHDDQAPALLLALAADKDIYSEVLPIYREINAKVTLENNDAFKKLHMTRLLKIKHIKIVCDEK
jgi:hypothetical protein